MFSKALYIPVKDWESCEGGWGGTISYTLSSHSVHNSSDESHHSSITNAVDGTEQGEIHLRGNPDGETGWGGSSNGSFTAQYSMKKLDIARSPPDPYSKRGAVTITGEATVTGTDKGNTNVGISPLGDNKYEISSGFGGNIPGVETFHSTCAGDCKDFTEVRRDWTKPFTHGMVLPKVTAQEDPNEPGVLHGSFRVEDFSGVGTTLTGNWDLMQCQGRR